ncbi:MAG: hypothetical protein KIT09_07855 [Bryobacteraceae bacterium]|nr:hypothetical protein [Bryobacteraceae bacterium]
MLLKEVHAPRNIPEAHYRQWGGLGVRLDYRVVRIWELGPEIVFASGVPELLPWVPAMNATERDVERAARALLERNDRTLASCFGLFGTMRYDIKQLKALLGRLGMPIFTEQMLMDSDAVRWLVEQNRKEAAEAALERGRVEGRVEEARGSIREVLARRFPAMPVPAALDDIVEVDRLKRIFSQLLSAESEQAAAAVLRDAQ